jgi:hypothetical protein
VAFSQTLTPAFSVKIAFEDKAKHKDTITIGYDPLATNDGIDTIFGEQDTWTQPWDSLFDVRVSHNPYNLGKIAVAKQTTDTLYCYESEPSYIFSSTAVFGVYFRCKGQNFPITISWDYTLFWGQSCHAWSAIVYNCASSVPSIFPVQRLSPAPGVFNLQMPDQYPSGYMSSISSNVLAPGGGIVSDTVYSFPIYLSSKFDLFNDTWTVSIKDQTVSQLASNVYPNPAQNEVNVTLPEPAWCYITDMSGKVVQNTYLQAGTTTTDVSTLPKGLYLMRLQGKNQRQSVHKLVVE